jgi:hypothetical protein
VLSFVAAVAGTADACGDKPVCLFLISGVVLFLTEILVVAFSFTNFNIAYAFGSRDEFLMGVGPDCLRSYDVLGCDPDDSAMFFQSADCSSIEGRWICNNNSYGSCTQGLGCPQVCAFTGSECTKCRLSGCSTLERLYRPIQNMAITNVVFFLLFVVGIVGAGCQMADPVRVCNLK